MKSEQGAYEVKIYAETGKWPMNDSEKMEKEKDLFRKFPSLLLKNPDNQKLFDEDELALLLERAEKGSKI